MTQDENITNALVGSPNKGAYDRNCLAGTINIAANGPHSTVFIIFKELGKCFARSFLLKATKEIFLLKISIARHLPPPQAI